MEKHSVELEAGYTPKARSDDRNKLQNDVEAFLEGGGKVSEVATGERADPPRKPENNYGRGSI